MDDIFQTSGLPADTAAVIRRLVAAAGYDLENPAESAIGMHAALATLQVCDAMRQRRKPQTSQVKRNDPCPCGSGKKYKKCCLGSDPASPVARDYAPGNPIERPELVPRIYDTRETAKDLDRLRELFQEDASLRQVRFDPEKVLTFLWETQDDTTAAETDGSDPKDLVEIRERMATRYLREVEGRSALGNVHGALLRAARDSARSDADVRSLATGLAMIELEPDEDEEVDENAPANPLLATLFVLSVQEALAVLDEMAREEDARQPEAADAPGESPG